jgi:hypothetical protein
VVMANNKRDVEIEVIKGMDRSKSSI